MNAKRWMSNKPRSAFGDDCRLLRLAMAAILFLVLLVRANPVHAGVGTWTTQGPFGGSVLSLVVNATNSNTVYAGTQRGGVFKSTNGGTIWSSVNTGLTSDRVSILTPDPTNSNTLYAVSLYTGGGVFKTTNGGNTWSNAGSGLGGWGIRGLAVDPTNSNTLYAGLSGGGMYKNATGGTGSDWFPVNTGLTDPFIRIVLLDKANSNIVYADTDSGLFKTITGGASWSLVNTSLPGANALVLDPSNSNTLYAGIGNGQVYKSIDGGSTWSAIGSISLPSGKPLLALLIDPVHANILYAGTNGSGVFKSTNGGASLFAINTGLTDTDINTIALAPTTPNTLYAGAVDDGVFKTINGGTTWSIANRGMIYDSVPVVTVAPSNPSIVYAGKQTGDFYKSTDGGANWSRSSTVSEIGSTPSALAVDPTDPNTVYEAWTAWSVGNAVIKSTDGGVNWSTVSNVAGVFAIVIAPTSPHTIYIAGYNAAACGLFSPCGLFKSTDGGDNWSAANSGLPSRITALALDPSSASTLYAAADFGMCVDTTCGLYKTTNSANSWSVVMSWPSITTAITCIAIDPTNANTLYVCMSGSGVSKSTTGGTSWSAINNGLTSPNVKSLVIDPTSPNTIYAGTSDAGVFKSTDGGANWSAMNSGLTYTNVHGLAFDSTPPKTLYAATDGGVFDYEMAGYPIPTITSISPAFAIAGGAGFTLTVNGTNFVNGSAIRCGTYALPTTFVNSTQLTAAVGADDIATPAIKSCNVLNPGSGGPASNAPAFYITQPGAAITGSNSATGTNPSASTGGATGVTAMASGTGTVNVAIYNGNPGGTPQFSSSGAYVDVQVPSGSSFTSLTIVDCNLNGGTQVYWWNGSGLWSLASNQTYDPVTKCVTITVNNSTSPSLSDLTGTPFGAATTNYKINLPLIVR